MEIRKATLQDYDIIHNIALITWDATYSKILTAEQMDYMLDMMYSRKAIEDQMAIKGHEFLIIEENGAALGFASYEINYRPETTKLHKLYVLPQTHGKGAGRALLTIIENAARLHINDKLVLNVNRFNPALSFYLKSGFENLGDDNIDIGNGYVMEDYLMQKQL
jgi:GNAT superfamily N-acetyltransferase